MVFLLTSMTSGQACPLAQDGSTGQHALKTHFVTENTVDNIVGTLYGTDLIGESPRKVRKCLIAMSYT